MASWQNSVEERKAEIPVESGETRWEKKVAAALLQLQRAPLTRFLGGTLCYDRINI